MCVGVHEICSSTLRFTDITNILSFTLQKKNYYESKMAVQYIEKRKSSAPSLYPYLIFNNTSSFSLVSTFYYHNCFLAVQGAPSLDNSMIPIIKSLSYFNKYATGARITIIYALYAFLRKKQEQLITFLPTTSFTSLIRLVD